MKQLWKSIIGSHLWGMNRPESDIDYYVAYQAPSTDFLLGMMHEGGHNNQNDEIDIISFEIGKIVSEVKKGNINHLMGVLSPLAEPSIYREELATIIRANPCANIINSAKGMAKHNIKHFIEQRKQIDDDQRLYAKKIKTITRILEFAIRVVRDGVYEFKKPENETPESCYSLIVDLEDAYNKTTIPKKIDEEPFNKYLLKLRMENLNFGDKL